MVTQRWTLGMILMALASTGALGIVVLDPAYQVEIYAQYVQTGERGLSNSMAFDPQGNLYLPHLHEGAIYKVDPSGLGTRFVDGLDVPTSVEWINDPAYGNYLYVTELSDAWDPGRVTRITATGAVDSYVSVDWEPIYLAYDSVGNYGNQLYVATNVQDKIIAIAPNGAQTTFSPFPYNLAGGIRGMAFDPGSQYGGSMYVGSYSDTDPTLAGVFQIDASGGYTRFTPDLAWCYALAFDPEDDFDGSMFAIAVDDPELADPAWKDLYRVDTDGAATLFAQSDIFQVNAVTFGPDGAMYVAEFDWGNSQTTISRITLVPEPATLTLVSLGAIGLLRRRRH